ncbi:MAG: DUF3299 domain-containing protein [Sneathiella sp.]|uniref:DUF3299 domain-containing protein n=1 Tax=Sneathiella sp. TaxID=1964365 RepID=UPI0030033690
MNKVILAFFVVALAFPIVAFSTEPERKISWDDLYLPPPQDVTMQMKVLRDGDLADTLSNEELQSRWEALEEQAYPVVEEMDGQIVRIPGFIVPVDFEDNVVREFLLVPYFGACIHTPPPPPNQVIFVKAGIDFEMTELYDPVWVTGEIRVLNKSTELAETGYTLTANSIFPYVED